ncbi:hypothetical protein N0B31_12370 [Salinirubellus salinus]|jgi:hypothetical protein|uniref:Uncharacterized protein n=1 Tax=Salinirubellus salinus TaxID=1364945 RepID=A0A9E7R098_9EURY|nr:hypothetical protein [Salinirubellus salinus]UWM52944.1 hypothetical protein N0B31_12370 [Salinirubellus salinus]
MAMSNTILMASAMAAVNVLLLGTLTVVWLRNYRTFGSSMIAGLVAFGAVLLLENAAAIYFFFSMQMLYSGDPGVQQVVMVLRALQMVALVFLTYVTVK